MLLQPPSQDFLDFVLGEAVLASEVGDAHPVLKFQDDLASWYFAAVEDHAAASLSGN